MFIQIASNVLQRKHYPKDYTLFVRLSFVEGDVVNKHFIKMEEPQHLE